MAEPKQESAGAVRNLAEFLGCLMFVGFLYLCWEPLALLGGGVLLVLWANVTSPHRGRIGRSVGAALGAARRAWADASRRPA